MQATSHIIYDRDEKQNPHHVLADDLKASVLESNSSIPLGLQMEGIKLLIPKSCSISDRFNTWRQMLLVDMSGSWPCCSQDKEIKLVNAVSSVCVCLFQVAPV